MHTFMKARKYLVLRCREKVSIRKESGSVENVFYKALGNRFRLTSKLVS